MDHVTTLPNIMKEFNPGLMGCSEDLSNSLEESLNVGKVQATTINITAQTNLLSERICNNPDINYENDWKVVTVLWGITIFVCRHVLTTVLDLWGSGSAMWTKHSPSCTSNVCQSHSIYWEEKPLH